MFSSVNHLRLYSKSFSLTVISHSRPEFFNVLRFSWFFNCLHLLRFWCRCSRWLCNLAPDYYNGDVDNLITLWASGGRRAGLHADLGCFGSEPLCSADILPQDQTAGPTQKTISPPSSTETFGSLTFGFLSMRLYFTWLWLISESDVKFR